MGWVIGLGIAAVLVLLLAKFCYNVVFYNRNDKEDDPYLIPPGDQYQAVAEKMRGMIRDVDEAPYEQVYILSEDQLRLSARYYHISDGAPVMIQFHGYHGNGVREYCGGWRMANSTAFNSLVVDQRAHGKSGGHTITFGIKERYDCLRWVEYAAERFGADTPIILSGVSMGAATVLMASELPLPGNVIAITADCPYSSPGAIIRKVCRDVKIPGWLAYPFVALGGLIFGRFRLWESSAVGAVQNTNIPILLFHGDEDLFVPHEMSLQIKEACASHCELVIIPGAGHGLCYLINSGVYEETVSAFLRNAGL